MKPGDGCSFYHEGGAGQRRWVIGWRYGVVRSIPIKGQHKGWAHVEVTAGYKRDPVRVWIPSDCVNEAGDTTYHGRKLIEVVRERKEQKIADQKKADRKVKRKA